MQLSLRLSAIAGMVSEGNRLVDVGCDHGFLPIWLVSNHKIPSAIAMDVRKGPLSRAQEHIDRFGLAEYIETRLGDGLEKLKAGEGDTLVIAGMGGPLMERILANGKPVLSGFRELILQPQSDVPHFRRFVRENGWEIIQEELILEDGKFYPMMKAVPENDGSLPEWTKEEYLFGKYLLAGRHPVLKQYLQRELRIREEILEKLPDALKRKEEVSREADQIRHVLNDWDTP